MMLKFKNLLVLAVCVCMALSCFAGCQPSVADPTDGPTEPVERVDYAGQLKLNMNSETAKIEIQRKDIKAFVDGDTTHFHVPTSIVPSGVLKARYLAINTPESTGKIEEYGKKASNFTRSKLENATDIVIESDTPTWDLDSTGGRYLVWIWYKTSDSEDYRNLNLEILQEGLAIASSSANNRYGTFCMSALSQAKALKLNVFSGQRDPDFFYGEAIELTMKELRCNIDQYNGAKVAFEGVVTVNNNNGVYVEALDEETGLYNGIYVYYGFNLAGAGLEALKVGNLARIVGTVSYYEGSGSYQVSGLTYRELKPNDPNNVQMISQGHSPAYTETDAATFVNGKVTVEVDEEDRDLDYGEFTMGSSISMKNLVVKSIYTTVNEESASKGAMTLTCEVDGVTVTIRTIVLYDENGDLITQDRYEGQTIDVRGMVDCFEGEYQIKVFHRDNIIIH